MYGIGVVDDVVYTQNDSALIVYNIFLFQQNMYIPIIGTPVEWHKLLYEIHWMFRLLLSFTKLSKNKCGPGGEAEIFKPFSNSVS